MFYKKGYLSDKTFNTVVIILIVFSLLSGLYIFQFDTITGKATADCIDNDNDGYLHEDCAPEDLDCSAEFPLISYTSDEDSVTAYEDYIVYKSGGNIYLYNILTNVETPISSTIINANPRIHGNYVVWQSLISEGEVAYWQIILYEIGGSETQITSGLNHKVNPDIASNTIVWSEYDDINVDWDIKGYIINQDTLYTFTDTANNDSFPRIENKYIAYVTRTNQGAGIKEDDKKEVESLFPLDLTRVKYKIDNIALYSIDDKQTRAITNTLSKDTTPEINNGIVVWQSYSTETSWDIYSYDISTSQTKAISNEKNSQKNPSKFGDKIIWMDKRTGDFNIFMYDIGTEKTSQITSDPSEQYSPVITGTDIFWVDDRNGDFDIYTKTIDGGDCGDFLGGDCDDNDATIYPGANETCGDLIDNNCDGEIDENCNITGFGITGDVNDTNVTAPLAGDSCLIPGTDSNYWSDEGGLLTNAALDGEIVYPIVFTDGTCPDGALIPFYIYDTDIDTAINEYYTFSPVDTIYATVISEEGADGIMYQYAFVEYLATWPEFDGVYYYFVADYCGEAVTSDTMLICQSGDCVGESIVVTDIADYTIPLSTAEECLGDDFGLPEENFTYDEFDEFYDDEIYDDFVDCYSLWDCSGVGWSECFEGYKSRDLYQCIYPDPDYYPDCWADEYLPDEFVECFEEEIYEGGGAYDEDVPVFTTINLILVILFISGYYIRKKLK